MGRAERAEAAKSWTETRDTDICSIASTDCSTASTASTVPDLPPCSFCGLSGLSQKRSDLQTSVRTVVSLAGGSLRSDDGLVLNRLFHVQCTEIRSDDH